MGVFVADVCAAVAVPVARPATSARVTAAVRNTREVNMGAFLFRDASLITPGAAAVIRGDTPKSSVF